MRNLIEWDPLHELENISEQLNHFFGRKFPAKISSIDHPNFNFSQWSPAVDIIETSDAYIVKAELPEVRREDVHINVENGVLNIRGDKKQEKEEKNKKFHRTECFYGSFERSFTLPENTDESNVSAEFKDGVLNIYLPKTEKGKSKTFKVEIK